jgi:tetratricopeptide (TPR) repeat protein
MKQKMTLPLRVLAAGLLALASLPGLSSLCGCASAVPLPAKAVRLNSAGALALAQGDLTTAEARLSVAIEYSPRFVEAWVNLGYVELKRANFEQARRDFERARELNQDIPAPHHALGVLADEEGKGADAERHYRAALKVDPGFAPARANLARLLYARGQYENAREQFQRLVEVEPDAVEGWAGEAESLLQLGREADAETVVARGRDRLGDAPALRVLVARERMALGEWDEAEASLAQLVGDADRSQACAAWAWIAVARLGKHDLAGARQAAQAALAIDRRDAVAAYAMRLTAGAETPSRRGPR